MAEPKRQPENTMSEAENLNEWLGSLGVGDVVALQRSSSWRGITFDLLTIRRKTSTQLVCTDESGRERRIRRDRGNELRGNSFKKIEPATDQIHAKREAYSLTQWFAELNVSRTRPNTNQLRAMKQAYEANADPT